MDKHKPARNNKQYLATVRVLDHEASNNVLIFSQKAVLGSRTTWNHKNIGILSTISMGTAPEDGVDAIRLIV
ncbi:hypothetical protein GCM10007385_09940 [Tateyamaria omphalii]|nr:hypothetical protein GCM10007385_09940 [Tateyamaria omphalii]